MTIDFIKITLLLLDIAIVWLFIWFVFKILTVSINKFFFILGIIIISILKYILSLVDLPTIKVILDYLFSWGPIIIIIIFHDEIKHNIELLGRNSFKITNSSLVDLKNNGELFWHKLDYSLKELSSLRRGALITLQNEDSLKSHIKEGEIIESNFTTEIVKGIFNPKFSSLHDGAMIIKKQKIYSVANFYPMQTNLDISKKLGTRHRAGLSISQLTDSVTFIVSEETSVISVAFRGKIFELDPNFHSFDVVNDLINSSKGDSYEA